MKKLFLFFAVVALTFSLNSCSSSGSNSSGENKFTFKVNGTTKTFTNLSIGNDGSKVYVYGHIGPESNTSEAIALTVDLNATGGDSLFKLFNDIFDTTTKTYYPNSSFVHNITTNNSTSLKATFSGTLVNISDSSDSITITNGNIEMAYPTN
jgi:hypothetical protein